MSLPLPTAAASPPSVLEEPKNVSVEAPINAYKSVSGAAPILAAAKVTNGMDVVPHVYATGPKGSIGVKYNKHMILNPLSDTAISIESKSGYFLPHFLTRSLIMYLPKTKHVHDPINDPARLSTVDIVTPPANPYVTL
mmetsp:Transcript_8881/g.13327  ORF Transcript_8881/g.13327 Transcript_8881/m.13327 type:complete len:138 (-) Transcript_8881:274-687(-)